MERMPSFQQRGPREDVIDFTLMAQRIAADVERLLRAYEVILSRFPGSTQKRLAERYMREAQAIVAQLDRRKLPRVTVDTDTARVPLGEADVNAIRQLTTEVEQATVAIRSALGSMLKTGKETGKDRNPSRRSMVR